MFSAVREKLRCRMHGGPSPGAPRGNRNAWKHGERAAETLETMAAIRAMISAMSALDG